MKEEKIRLYLHEKIISLNYRNWNKMIINNLINHDVKSMKVVRNKFARKSYLVVIDEYRCNEFYFNLVKELKFDHRINEISKMVNIWKQNKRKDKEPSAMCII
jgi:hypothetical protein